MGLYACIHDGSAVLVLYSVAHVCRNVTLFSAARNTLLLAVLVHQYLGCPATSELRFHFQMRSSNVTLIDGLNARMALLERGLKSCPVRPHTLKAAACSQNTSTDLGKHASARQTPLLQRDQANRERPGQSAAFDMVHTFAGDIQLVHLSCSYDTVWACDSRGLVYMRIGSLRPPARLTLPPAWVPVESAYQEDSPLISAVSSPQVATGAVGHCRFSSCCCWD